jgi:hypothetical protein
MFSPRRWKMVRREIYIVSKEPFSARRSAFRKYTLPSRTVVNVLDRAVFEKALEKAREGLNRIARKADLSLDGWTPSVSDISKEALMAVRNEARPTIAAIDAALKGE